MAKAAYAPAGRVPVIAWKRVSWIAAIILLLAVLFAILNRPSAKGVQFTGPASVDTLGQPAFQSESLLADETPYGRVLEDYEAKGYADYAGETITVQGNAYTASGGAVRKTEEEGREAVATGGDDGWVEWTFEVPDSAMYAINVDYLPLDGKKSGAERSFEIDGKRPFKEASRASFARYWQESGDFRLDDEGDQIRSLQHEERAWRTKPLEQPEMLYKEPYRFYFAKGKHTLRFNDVREPMAISNLALAAPEKLPTYAEASATYKSQGYKNADSTLSIVPIQTEVPLEASELSLRAEWNDDPHSEPKATNKTRYNVFGGNRWKTGGQTASWQLEAPEDGLYEIAFRYATPTTNQVSHRRIQIDGSVPFAEMQEYAYPFIRGWQTEPLKDADNKPYLFYLTKGTHTLTSTATIGPIRQTLQTIDDTLGDLTLLSSQVIKVTASSKDATGKITADPNQDWNLEDTIPNLIKRLTADASAFQTSLANLRAVNGGKTPPYGQSLQTAISLLHNMARNTEKIPYKLNELGSVEGALGTAMQSMKEQPLYYDYIMVAPPGYHYARSNSTFVETMFANYQKFIASFHRDKQTVSASAAGGKAEPVLKVWIARGREWTDIINQLILEDFTSKTGIKVEVNTIPLGSEHLLLLAYTGGNAPDVALGVSPTVPVDFSVRGALVDLNQFPDSQEVEKRFLPQSLIPLQYGKGLFALPETMDFNLLFYRTDIMERLGVKPPDTWQDVYALLPRLQEEGMDFYYPDGVGGYTPFLFQHGGRYYTPDGLKSALDRPEALSAFKEWTDLSNNYKLPLKADFFQRFRNGEMPIGIGNYDFYVKLATSAPELNGRWRMIPMPGVKGADGIVDRSASGAGASSPALGTTAQTGVIMKTTKNKDAAWSFLKWWMSDDVQVRYSLEVESLLGVGSRWNSANIEAMKGMSWSKEELATIMEQWSWLKEQPVVLGGYYTSRHLTNAWNQTVLQGANPRIALEDAVKEINKELERKQAEFGTNPAAQAAASGAGAEGGSDR